MLPPSSRISRRSSPSSTASPTTRTYRRRSAGSAGSGTATAIGTEIVLAKLPHRFIRGECDDHDSSRSLDTWLRAGARRGRGILACRHAPDRKIGSADTAGRYGLIAVL